MTQENKNIIIQTLEDNQENYIAISQAIHAKPEIGNEEYFASQKLITLLESEDFIVERAVAGHETDFFATYDSKQPGPTIAFLAEYDALPGIGHACGHNIIGTTSTAAAIALSKVVHSTGGKIVVLGTPAEEGGPNGSAKGSFANKGLLKGVDAALMIHPSGKSGLTSETLAVDPLDFHFYGKTAHAAGAPHLGINALDAVIQLFNGINALRQQLTSDVRIHGVITHGGEIPNVIPDYASARFYVRADTWKKTVETSDKVRKIAEGAALATGATVKIERFQNEVKDFVLNDILDNVIREELENAGELVHEKEDGAGKGSTDAGNISYEVPTAHPYIKIGPDDLAGHTHAFRDAAGSPKGDAALITGAKVLAKTGYRLLTDKQLLTQVKSAYELALAKKNA